ncbi:MAG: aldo/keto reductase [Deltaproteobacteria bacterium]|nr:aldo/keto reductase [Deltaproteobacteria bacterium]
MKKIKLGSTGLEVAELGLGAMYLPRVAPEVSDALIQRALDLGIQYFDTASAYQDSEEKLGRVLSRRGKDFVITSRSASYKTGLDAFRQDFERSFERLKLPFIDFYGFHAVNQPGELEMVMKEPLFFLKEQKAGGRIGHIAITSHNPKTLSDALDTGEFELAMFPFNIIEQEPLDGLLAKAASLGVATSVMKPLAGGVIESTELALRFFFNHPAGVVTPGMMSIEQLEQNFTVFKERQPLSGGELQRLEDEVAVLGKEFCRRCSYCMPCPNGIMIPFVHMLHMKTWQKPMSDDVAYTLELAQRMLPALEKCTGCGACVEKCPYAIPTPQRVQELLQLLKSRSR